MKKLLFLSIIALLASLHPLRAQSGEDKSKRASPPATVSQTIAGGATVTINYSQPSLKGRTIGKDVEPKDGQVWRAGANEATTFETNKPLMVEGKPLPAGKYALFAMTKGNSWTFIFNKVWNTWGAFDYSKNKSQDALQVTVQAAAPSSSSTEKLTYTIAQDGTVSLKWGTKSVSFRVRAN